MADVWGEMPKSQIDPEKIEEAIERLIQEHNDDPTAHLADGQALKSHQTEEIIDHIAGSIVADKLSGAQKLYTTTFTSSDMYIVDGNGLVELLYPELSLRSSGPDPDHVAIYSISDALSFLDFDKNPMFQVPVELSSMTNVKAKIQMGRYQQYETSAGFGFIVEGGELKARVWQSYFDDDTWVPNINDQLISGVDVTNFNVYRAEVVSAEKRVVFSVNGVEVASILYDRPNSSYPFYYRFYVESLNSGSTKRMTLSNFLFARD